MGNGYKGEKLNGKPHGQGILKEKGKTCIGEFKNGFFVRGRKSYKDGSVYDGKFEGVFGFEGRVIIGEIIFEGKMVSLFTMKGSARIGNVHYENIYLYNENCLYGDDVKITTPDFEIHECLIEQNYIKSGIWKDKNGDIFMGSFRKNNLISMGRSIFNDGILISEGKVYCGKFKCGKLSDGEILDEKKDSVYVFSNDKVKILNNLDLSFN